jgi:hypothetical protein
MPSDAELLKAYLADRDVPCPGCGYSLKGCVAEACPECGHAVTLAIGDTFWTRPRLRLLRYSLLILGVTSAITVVEGLYGLITWGPTAWPGTATVVWWGVFFVSHITALVAYCGALWRTRYPTKVGARPRMNSALTTALAVPMSLGCIYVVQTILNEIF